APASSTVVLPPCVLPPTPFYLRCWFSSYSKPVNITYFSLDMLLCVIRHQLVQHLASCAIGYGH
uniref:Uncharacterized protein n=1 Tax=Oryza brachyantha TaxID=4533 RepID=J3L323_ORYBR